MSKRKTNQRRARPAKSGRRNSGTTYERPEAPRLERKPPVSYGVPFVLLEDDQKQTFEFLRGSWVAYHRSIAECQSDCQVKQLSQKINGMTRYEIRLPL